MSLKTLVKLLEDAKFDVHNGEAPDGTKCPYVVLTDHEQPNFAADNKTYTETTSLRIRLVESGVHNWTLIGTLKNVLDGASLPYGITYVEETSEKVCETYFDIRFLGGIDNA
jgi:hypothetical protein